MPKINREEYEVLKGALTEGYEWIARDSHNPICVHRHKPVKHDHWIQQYWGNAGNGYKEIDDRLFQFIKWEDEEPHNIAELIEEYEYSTEHVTHVVNERVKALGKAWSESEETEVKNIEWLKGRFRGRKIFKPQNDREIGYNMAIDEFSEYVDRLDESETLSQKWIDKNKFEVNGWNEAVHVEDLQNLLVPKQEKIKVDKEDAENIKSYKEEGWRLSHLINDTGTDANHDELLAQAWLAYPNIQVEEEQKYIIQVSENLFLAQPLGDTSGGKIEVTRHKEDAYKFKDLISIDTHLWEFKGSKVLKVEELEE